MSTNIRSACKSSASITTITLTLTALAACSGDTISLGDVHVKKALIKSAEGGTLEVFAGEHDKIKGAKISIPANALSRDTEITIGYNPTPITDSTGTAIGPVVEFGPDGTNFSAPAVITIPYDGTINRQRLKVFVKDASGLSTIPAHLLTLDEANKTVRFQMTHFTDFQCGNGMEPPPCDASTDCGPALGLPNWTCADGTIGGPTGNCVRNPDGVCGWEINWCPVDCTEAECGLQPDIAPTCPDGQAATVECGRRADGTCGWDIYCGNQCDPATGMGGFAPGTDPNTCGGCTDTTCPSGTICDPMTGNCVTSGEQCGNNICGDGEWCCNASCGTCAPLGGTCTEMACTNNCTIDPNGMTSCPPGTTCNPATGTCDPSGESCGGVQCGAGEYCCNPSCGVCAPFGAACDQQLCSSCGSDPTNPMGGTTCGPGEICAADGTCQPACTPADCGPAPGIMNWTCEDGSTGGPTGNCVPADASNGMGSGGLAPPPGSSQCVWEIIWCPRACEDFECGPQPGVPNMVCADGTVSGPTGRCLRNDDGTCSWEIHSCMGN